ncbi:MAG TPA: hypothetical protein VMN36_14835 [Verrucomicrobiales bacterium]|nr:hypothetical protein [Verrucomicrobiales bacterium]
MLLAIGLERGCGEEVDITTMRAVPPGNYLCNLRIHGKEELLNFEVKGTELLCVNAKEKGMIGLRGKTHWIGNGVFMTRLEGGDYVATQFWVFSKDGTAVIKEVPDRGEKQRAVPVTGETLDK